MQLAALEFQVEATEKLLANEKSNVSSVEQANKNLLEELADVKQELEVVSKDREAGSAESMVVACVAGTPQEIFRLWHCTKPPTPHQ